MGGGRPWFPCDTRLHRDERIIDLGEAHGPAGASAWVWLLGEAKAADDDGTVTIRWRTMAHDVWLHSVEQARSIVMTLAVLGLIHLVSEDASGAVVTIKGWAKYQPAKRLHADRQAAYRERQKTAPRSQSDATRVTGVTHKRREEKKTPCGASPTTTAPDRASAEVERASPISEEVELADEVLGILQRGVDGLTTDEPVKKPARQAILVALREHKPDAMTARAIAVDVRSIVQSQNRAPNIAALYAQRLMQQPTLDEAGLREVAA